MRNRHKEIDNKVSIVVNYTRYYRKLRKMTQKEVAESIDVTPQRFASIETNKHISNIIRVMAIANILDVTVDNLYKQEYVTKEQYNRLRKLDRNLEESKELEEVYTRLDLISKIEDKSEDVLQEMDKLNKIIWDKSIFRYGDVLEVQVWDRIKKINDIK
ncbi:MAG: helix-turn-helix transcriptional regulator [Clostridium sp.]